MSKVYQQFNSVTGIAGVAFGGGGGGGGGGGSSKRYPSSHPVSQAQKADNSRNPATVAKTQEYATAAACGAAGAISGGIAGAATGAFTKNPYAAMGTGGAVASATTTACTDLAG